MSLVIAVPFAVAAAIAYGASSAVQHAAVQRTTAVSEPGTTTGSRSGRLRLRVLRDRRWLLSVGGDGLGVLLQIVALATGPVVVVQPLLVLAVPVALPVGYLLGAPRPGRGQLVACVAIIAGLGGFFALLGPPDSARPAASNVMLALTVIALIIGVLICMAVRRQAPVMRAVGYGAVAGAWFGLVAVLLNAAASQTHRAGLAGLLAQQRGLIPLLGLLLLGGCAFVLTQLAFGAGPLVASFPASESAAPITAVVVGALLLHEAVPIGGLRTVGYLLCVAAVLAGTVRLAGGATMSRSENPQPNRLRMSNGADTG